MLLHKIKTTQNKFYKAEAYEGNISTEKITDEEVKLECSIIFDKIDLIKSIETRNKIIQIILKTGNIRDLDKIEIIANSEIGNFEIFSNEVFCIEDYKKLIEIIYYQNNQ